MENYKVKDIKLAPQGALLVEWAERHMPVLNQIRKRFEKEQPLANITIAACLHVTKETAILVETLKAGGASVALCGSNPLSTQDEVASYLAKNGINVYAWREQKTDEYFWCINKVLDFRPHITMDDGADVVGTLHKKRTELIDNVMGGTEETTTGVIRLRAMEQDNALKYPIIAVNDAYTKYLFDNRYGTGQSTIDGILRATSILLAGKYFVVAGYGWCGRGLALRAKGMGAKVIVTEVDSTKALEAVMDGFYVMPMDKAALLGDIFVTLTGNTSVIRKEHMEKMKDGVIISNSGHFNVEIDISDLSKISSSKRKLRPNLVEYTLKSGKRINLLAEGRLVNLAAAEGHPSEVMDMSFANQALNVEYLVKNKGLEKRVYCVPKQIDELVANLKLKSIGTNIDTLTEKQKKYLATWDEGTI
jgi:adenosylhomocysteinase